VSQSPVLACSRFPRAEKLGSFKIKVPSEIEPSGFETTFESSERRGRPIDILGFAICKRGRTLMLNHPVAKRRGPQSTNVGSVQVCLQVARP